MPNAIGPRANLTDLFPGRGQLGLNGEPTSRGPSTAIEGDSTITVPFDGLDPDQIREWDENFSPYENLADNEEVAERAWRFVSEHVTQSEEKRVQIKQKWEVLNYILQGNSVVNWDDPEGVHSPQIYQMVENIEARVSETVLNLASGRGEWFKAVGRDEEASKQDDEVTAYHDYELDKNRFKSKVPEQVRTMLVHGFCVWKSTWRREVDYRVKKTRTKKATSRGVKWKTQRREEKTIVKDGIRVDQIDPFWFLVDEEFTDPQDMMFVGDRSYMVFDEIAELGEQGVFKNWRELEDQEPVEWDGILNEWSRASRSHTSPASSPDHGRGRPEGSPKRFIVTEIWGLFDLYGTGRARECVITIANGRTVLRVQENPFDDKHRPYAVARASKYPFNFDSVGPLDHCIPLQIEIDKLRSMAMAGTELAMSPFVFVDSKGEGMPESLWGAQPGQIFEVPGGSVKFAEVTSPMPHMRYATQVLRQDVEETAGGPRAYMGTGDNSTTATEFQGKLQEGNRRIRSFIRSFTDGCQELLRHMHSLNAQYLTMTKKFRVLGRRAKALKAYSEVNPEMFDTEMDFEFHAISNLHIAGMEATNLQLFLNTMAPILPMLEGVVDMPALARRWADVLGVNQGGEDIIHIPDDPSNLLDQAEELVLMMQGDQVPISELDDHEDHLDFLGYVVADPFFLQLPDDIQQNILLHMKAHEAALLAQQRMRQLEQDPYRRFAPLGGQGAYPGQGSPPSATNMQRQTQAMGAGSQGTALTHRGETPGPMNGQQIAAPGRAGGFFQEQNEAVS